MAVGLGCAEGGGGWGGMLWSWVVGEGRGEEGKEKDGMGWDGMGWDEWACRGGVGIWVTEVGKGEKSFGCWDCLRKQVWGFRILRRGLCLLLYQITFHCTKEAQQQLSLETPGMTPNAHIRPPSFRHCPQRPKTNPLPPPSNRPRNTQLPNLPQHPLHPRIQLPLRVHLSRIRIQKLLHLRHPTVRLGTEAQLDLHQRLEARIQIRNPQVNQLGQFAEELLVERFVGRARELGFALRAGEFGGVFVGFFDEFLDAGAGGVVVEEFVVAFLDACGVGGGC